MLAQVTTTENKLNALLPVTRLEHTPPVELLAAARKWSQLVWDAAQQLGPIRLSANETSRGRELAQRPIFILGVHRSGTTLIRDMLDGHPDLVVLPSEGTYLTNLESKIQSLPRDQQMALLGMEWLRRLINPINQPPYWLLGRSADEISPYVDFARYLMAWWPVVKDLNSQWPHLAVILAYASVTNNLNAKYWVDKTPVNERFFTRLRTDMPQAKFIHIIREPAAILSSRKKMEPGVSLKSILCDIKMSFEIAAERSSANDPQYLLLRYEELCDKPSETIDSITSFLSIDVSPVLATPTVAGIPSQANSSFNKEAIPGKIISKRTNSNSLSKTEQQLLSAYIGNISARLGYPLAKTSFLNRIYLLLCYRLF